MYYAIEFTNNDPLMIKVFLKFLRESLGAVEERIKGQLFLYTDQDFDSIKLFWSELTNIPTSRFQKVIVLKQRSGRYHPSKYGTFKIRYPHKAHFVKMQGIIQKIKGEVA